LKAKGGGTVNGLCFVNQGVGPFELGLKKLGCKGDKGRGGDVGVGWSCVCVGVCFGCGCGVDGGGFGWCLFVVFFFFLVRFVFFCLVGCFVFFLSYLTRLLRMTSRKRQGNAHFCLVTSVTPGTPH